MPRKTPLSPIDLTISRQLKALREECRMSREELSRLSRVSFTRIAMVELGRLALYHTDAIKLLPALASAFTGEPVGMNQVNPLWLTEGRHPVRLGWPFPLPAPHNAGLSYRDSFSAFVSKHQDLLRKILDGEECEIPSAWQKDWDAHRRHMLTQIQDYVTMVNIMDEFHRARRDELKNSLRKPL